MGLDMYATAIKGKVNSEVDFDTNNIQDYEELHYWRKHPNLHGWMENLYYDKGGKDDSFNGSDLVLTESDLDSLEQDIIDGNLPNTSGFFFGQTDGSERDDDLEFVAKARKAIKEGKTVYYSSSW
jgi:hypothetical protein